MENTDLFEQYDQLPKHVQELITDFGDTEGYAECEEFLKKMNSVGYTFEYQLDGRPLNLKKMNPSLKTDQQLAWEFVEEYYPNYHSIQEIADSDTLQRVIDLEFHPDDESDSANQLYNEIAGKLGSNDLRVVLWEAQRKLWELNHEIYEKSICEYMRQKFTYE